jgi:hypothetical protein
VTLTVDGARATHVTRREVKSEYERLQSTEAHDALRRRAVEGQANAEDLALLDRLDGLEWMLK